MLRLERYNAAVSDAQIVINHLHQSQDEDAKGQLSILYKAMFRKAKGLYNLKRWQESRDLFLEFEEKISEAKEWWEKAEKRVVEQTMGQYDLVRMFRDSNTKSNIRLDIADYIGHVTVQDVSGVGGGRGVVAVEDVQPGELIMMTKAFSIVYRDDLPTDQGILSLNFYTSRQDKTNSVYLRQDIAYKLSDQPEKLSRVLNLYAGPDSATLPYSLSEDFYTERQSVDGNIIDKVTTYNSFGPSNLKIASLTISHDLKDEDAASALFDRASLFNHSCLRNAIWVSCRSPILFRDFPHNLLIY